MPTNDPRQTKAQRQAEARAKALELRKKQERAAKRNRIVAIVVAVVVVLGLGGLAFVIVNNNNKTASAYSNVVFGDGTTDPTGQGSNIVVPALSDVTAPSTAQDDAGIPISKDGVGKAGAGNVVVSIYFDLQCPYCQRFDTANHAELDKMAASGDVTVTYYPISFLDGSSQGTHYSNRAANAVAIVADKAPEKFTAFVTALYADQPAEGSSGLTDDKIASIAQGVGVPSSVTDTFTHTVDGTYKTKDGKSHDGTWRTFAPWVASATSKANDTMVHTFGKDGLGTPFVAIDGKEFKGDLYSTGPLTDAVNQAVAAKKG